ncbi:MAG: response regulator transcription factor [Nitrospirota bacterium]|jgi:DNA-binding NarL/FixJ family response regulator
MDRRTRIVIVDDHAMVREGIALILSMYEDVEVVGEAADGKEAIEKVNELFPDVVVMDIAMPGIGGLEATAEILKKHPGVRVLVLSQYDDKEYVSRFLKAGVSGYILKKAVGGELINAIRGVRDGGFYLSPSIASAVVDGYLGKGPPKVEDPLEKITLREREIIKLIAEGKSYKEIASFLDISVKTVVTHHTHIAEKLNTHSRAELIKFAIQKGIIRLDSPDN